jgi:hypothetical protein
MIEIDWNPSTKKLREFGLFALGGFGVLGALLAWRLHAFSGSGQWLWPVTVWTLAVISPILGCLVPRILKPLFIGLSFAAFPIGWVISMFIMGIIFFGIFTPIALFFRLIGRDELSLRTKHEAKTFWIKSPATPPAASSYYRQS